MEYKKLGDYCNITSSKRIFAEQYVTEGIPFYRSKEIIEKNNNQNISEPLFISKETYETIKEKYGVPEENDILLTSVGTLGVPYIVKNETFYFKDGNLTWFKNFKKELNQKYLYYWLSSKFGYKSLILKAIGSSQPALTIDILKKYKLLIPPLPTQQKIASILSAYDNLIQNYKKQIEALQTAASELYKEWFVRFRFPGWQNAKFENGIPKGWKVYRINDLCYINKNTVSSKDAKKEILYLDTGSITENVIDSFESYILEEAPSRARRIVKKNSIIFSTVRPNQNHYGILKTIPENLIVSTGFAVFDTKFDIANILYFFLSSKDFVDYCQMIAEGAVATYPSIKPEEIGKVKILLPTIDLAIKLNQSFESLFLRIENLQQQITNLTQQRDLLLSRLMSGKLEVE